MNMYLFESNGKLSGTKTLLTIGTIAVISRWFLGGFNIGGTIIPIISGMDVCLIISALAGARHFTSQNIKGTQTDGVSQ